MKDWTNKVHYLRDALKYESDNTMAQHALGVALGHLKRHEEALQIFDAIIEKELNKRYGPSNSLIYAVNTKIFSLKKLGKDQEVHLFLAQLISRLKSLGVRLI